MLANTNEYMNVLNQIKKDISQARARAARAVNSELVIMHWRIGNEINKHLDWGKSFIPTLSKDIRAAYPGIKGFSERSLGYMARFAREVNEEFLQQAAAKIPWGHIMLLLDKTEPGERRDWYIRKSLEEGWSRVVLDHQIDLLFYNIKLHCYVVIELKNQEFKPEFTGQLGFYVAAVDGELRGEIDSPTIGLLLCKTKDDAVAEYSLQTVNAPIGVSEYRTGADLPEEYAKILPSPEDLMARM